MDEELNRMIAWWDFCWQKQQEPLLNRNAEEIRVMKEKENREHLEKCLQLSSSVEGK